MASRTSSRDSFPLGFLVLNAGVERSTEEIRGARRKRLGRLCLQVVQLVRKQIGPVAAFRTAVTVVPRLPKTRSGKILRGTMQKIADDQEWKMPATIDDPAILDEITEALRGVGYIKHAGHD